jgi:hypothetical protein
MRLRIPIWPSRITKNHGWEALQLFIRLFLRNCLKGLYSDLSVFDPHDNYATASTRLPLYRGITPPIRSARRLSDGLYAPLAGKREGRSWLLRPGPLFGRPRS